MRRKLVVIIALFVGALFIFLITALIHKKNGPTVTNSNICLTFINDVQNSKTQDAYNLFSSTLKSSISYSQWQQDINTLNADFGAATPQLTNKTTSTNGATSSGNQTVNSSWNGTPSASDTLRTYTVNNYGDVYTVNCAIAQSGSNLSIDSFSASLTSSSTGQ